MYEFMYIGLIEEGCKLWNQNSSEKGVSTNHKSNDESGVISNENIATEI